MKVTTIIYATLLAVASVDAAAAPVPQPDAEAVHRWCYRRGEPCSKLKRAAEAIAEANAEPAAVPEAEADAAHHWCYRIGEPCSKAKRDALAMAEAVAEAHTAAQPAPDAGETHISDIPSPQITFANILQTLSVVLVTSQVRPAQRSSVRQQLLLRPSLSQLQSRSPKLKLSTVGATASESPAANTSVLSRTSLRRSASSERNAWLYNRSSLVLALLLAAKP